MWAYQLKLPTDILVCDRKACGHYNGRNSYGRNVSALFLFRSQGNSDLGARPAAPPSDISSKLGLQGKEDYLVFDLLWPEISRNPAENCSHSQKLVLRPKISLTAKISVSTVFRHFTRSPYGFGVAAKILFRSHTIQWREMWCINFTDSIHFFTQPCR